MNYRKHVDYVSASQIAQLGTCEHKAMLEAQLGKQVSSEQAAAIREGNARHEHFHRQGQTSRSSVESKPWCFVATAVYGEGAPELVALRTYRDDFLRLRPWGRALVRFYYRSSPGVVAFLTRFPSAVPAVRWILEALIGLIQGRGR